MSQALPHSQARWQIRRAMLETELSAAQQALADARTADDRASLTEKLHDIERALRALGPNPTAKMG